MAEIRKELFHVVDFDEICRYFGCNPNTGLSSVDARRRLKLNGKNMLSLPERPETAKKRYFRNLFYGFGPQVIFCSLLCIILYQVRLQGDEIYEIYTGFAVVGGVMLVIFLIQGYFRFLQENDDYYVCFAFKDMTPWYCAVLRDGRKTIIRTTDVVLGDVLLVNHGAKISADVRFFDVDNLEVNDVALTGFSISRIIDPYDCKLHKWESSNFGFAGSLVTKGSGRGLVIACGDDTEIGSLAKLNLVSCPISRPRKHMKQLTIFTKIVIVILLASMSTAFFSKGSTSTMLLEFAVGVIINLTPLYIPPAMYLGLRRAKSRMLEQGLRVRNLEAASTLGLTTVICCGMSGTTTVRSWKVSELLVDGVIISVENDYLGGDSFMALVHAGILCSHAYFTPGQRGLPTMEKTIEGTDYEKAVLRFATRFVLSVEQMRKRYHRLAARPNDTSVGLQASVHRWVNQDNQIEYQLLIRGPWHLVSKHCTICSIDNQRTELDETLTSSIANTSMMLRQLGRKAHAFAWKTLEPDDFMLSLISKGFGPSSREAFETFMSHYCNSMEFLGLIAAMHPPSYNIRLSIDQCRQAGIKLVFCTQVDSISSRAIAQSMGLNSAYLVNLEHRDANQPLVESEIEQLLVSQRDLVFCGVAVEERQIIVNCCLRLQGVVTAIGSLVRDTPALRRAHVGIAASASAYVTQAAADAVLVNNNFVTLVKGIGESRLLFDNTKKALTYALSSNMAKLMIHICFILLLIPMRMFLITDVLIDCVVCFIPSLSLFYEHAEEDLLLMKPDVYNDYLIDRRVLFLSYIQVGILEANAVLIAYFVYMANNGFLPQTLQQVQMRWYDDTENDLVDSYGQEWTRHARKSLELRLSAVFTITICLMQLVNLIMSKTKRESLISHGFGNVRLLLAILFMICFCIFISEINSTKYLLTRSIEYTPVLVRILPMMLLLIITESARRYLIRKYPDSWLAS